MYLVLEGREAVSKEAFERTSGAVNFKAWFELFNNAVYVGRNNGYHHIRASHAVLTAVAKAGFDVYRVANNTYAVRRRIGIEIQ